jgi:hypothetical protein
VKEEKVDTVGENKVEEEEESVSKEPEDGKSITPLRDEDGKLNFLIVNCVILYIDRTFLLFWHELMIIDQSESNKSSAAILNL